MKKALLLALILGLAGCGPKSKVDIPSKDKRQDSIEIKADFLNSSEDFNLKKLKGKVVVLDFFATWCGPCRMEIPALVKIYNNYHSKGLEILGLSVEADDHQSRDYFNQFISKYDMVYPVGLASSETNRSYSIRSIPATYFIDKEGKVAMGFVGTRSEEEIEGVIQKLLEE